MTHEDLPWCRALLEDDLSMPAVVNLVIMAQRRRRMLEKRADADEAESEDADDAAHCLDRLCLALGLLTNLVQATPEGRHVVGNTRMYKQSHPPLLKVLMLVPSGRLRLSWPAALPTWLHLPFAHSCTRLPSPDLRALLQIAKRGRRCRPWAHGCTLRPADGAIHGESAHPPQRLTWI